MIVLKLLSDSTKGIIVKNVKAEIPEVVLNCQKSELCGTAEIRSVTSEFHFDRKSKYEKYKGEVLFHRVMRFQFI